MSVAKAMIEAAVAGESPESLVDATVGLTRGLLAAFKDEELKEKFLRKVYGEDFGDKEYRDFKRAAEGKRIRKRKPKTEAVDFDAEAKKVRKLLDAVISARKSLKAAMTEVKSPPKELKRAFKDLGMSMASLSALARSLEGKKG